MNRDFVGTGLKVENLGRSSEIVAAVTAITCDDCNKGSVISLASLEL